MTLNSDSAKFLCSQCTSWCQTPAHFLFSGCLLGVSPAPRFSPSDTTPTISLTGFRCPHVRASRPLDTDATISPARPTPRLGPCARCGSAALSGRMIVSWTNLWATVWNLRSHWGKCSRIHCVCGRLVLELLCFEFKLSLLCGRMTANIYAPSSPSQRVPPRIYIYPEYHIARKKDDVHPHPGNVE